MRTQNLLDCYPFKNPNFFSLEGRLNRAKYLCTMLVIGVIGCTVYTIWPSVESKTALAMSCAAFFPAVKRLHDIDRPGVWFLLVLVPILNIVLGITLLFKKGTVGANKYGDDPLSKYSEETGSSSPKADSKTVSEPR